LRVVNDTQPPPTAPQQQYRLLRKLLPGRLQPLLRGLKKRLTRRRLKLSEPYYTVYPFIQASPSRQESLVKLAEKVDREGIPGAIVECGVLDGGASALMAYGSSASGRPVHMFDAWRGLPETVEKDGSESRKWAGDVVGSPKRAARVMKLLKIPEERLHFHVGWFNETFPKVELPEVALLHIDCDFYEPTKLCLEKWFPSIVPGGYIQFDDYSAFQGCHLAVNEFLQGHPELKLEEYGQFGPAYLIRKPR
jgi:O-methyltransferase